MIELPESTTIAGQLGKTIKGKTIDTVIAAQSPHGFAWYYQDPKDYQKRLAGQRVDEIRSTAGYVELFTKDATILLAEGTNIRYGEDQSAIPKKHQLLVVFTDGSYFVCTVQMYGLLYAFPGRALDNPYYQVAQEKPSALGKQFTKSYFKKLFADTPDKLSAKALLAKEQRIPGLGNGCVQDILFRAKINPQSKIKYLPPEAVDSLYASVKEVLTEMVKGGGRDTEKDLFGQPGGYATILSNKTITKPCPVCGSAIVKKAFLGGNVYFCPECQPVLKS